MFGNFGPLVAVFALEFDNKLVFPRLPVALLDGRVKVISPPFSTLLANSSWQVRRNQGPLLGTIFGHKVTNELVFLRRMRSEDKAELTSSVHGPFTSSGLRTFCHLCKHCTSVLPLTLSAIFFQFLAPFSSTALIRAASCTVRTCAVRYYLTTAPCSSGRGFVLALLAVLVRRRITAHIHFVGHGATLLWRDCLAGFFLGSVQISELMGYKT